ncbi:MAG TPA: glycoside hydrolase family 28 protein [Verrucomicrobiae bacterium]|jgi:pectate lyase|nr:glycoside hydrolase family 28 protein [Verrucomicrobiae bacterium]
MKIIARQLAVSLFSVALCGLAACSSVHPAAPSLSFSNSPVTYDIRTFGAVADGQTLCTDAIRQAIAAANSRGGGTIFFPAGVFLTGPIHLQSHITLFLDSGCLLKFSTNFDDYLPMVPSRWEGIEVTNFSPLIYAQNAEDIAIRGRGTLDGQGEAWWKHMSQVRASRNDAERDKWQQEFAHLNPHPLVAENYKTLQMGFMRPPFFQPYNCTNVLVEGVTLINSPFWTVTPLYCENVTVEAVIIHNPVSPNTDGINPDSCQNVHISNCHISVGDNCIAIKSGRDADGRRVGRPAEDYTISNCTMADGHGGLVIGSEMSGGVKNITIANCIFDGTDRGIRITSARGRGGVVEDVRINNIVMRNIHNEAVIITTFYESSDVEPFSERTPVFRNIRLSGLTGDAKIAGDLSGLDEMPLDGISFSDVKLDTTTGLTIKDARNISLHNVIINTTKGSPIVTDRVTNLELDSVSTTQTNGAPLIVVGDAKNVFVHGCSMPLGTAKPVLMLGGTATDVLIEGNHFGNDQPDVKKDDTR